MNCNICLNIKIQPRWEFIPLTRVYLQQLFALYLPDKQQTEKIIIVLSELLENAVKYSKNKWINLRLKSLAQTGEFEIMVENSAKPKHALALARILRALKTGDIKEHYLQKMKEIKGYKHEKLSLMGLARIRHETGAKLSARFVRKEVVKVRAIIA